MLKVEERYQYDPSFRNLVDTIYTFILQGNFTPTEIREAAMLAQIKFEDSRIRPINLDDINNIRK